MSVLPHDERYLNFKRATASASSKLILSITIVVLGLIALTFVSSPNREAVGFFFALFAAWVALMGWIESAIANRAGQLPDASVSSKRGLFLIVATGFALAVSLLLRSPLAVPLFLALAVLVMQIAFALETWSVDKRQSVLMIPLILATIALENVIARAIGAIT